MTPDELADPYIDVDEWRDAPVRHRYVHGGFTGTDARFSIYLPPPELYEGRFFQHITPVPDSEHLAQGATGEEDKIGFSIASGAYFLETNGGGETATLGSSVDPTIGAYRANAAAAQHSRVVAAEMYGEHRAYGYAYGGSGGGYRTIGGAENTSGVWDGVVPYVIGSPMAIPNMFTIRMHAQRVLRHRFDQIVDAVEPGGGDMYAGLDVEERDALGEVTRMGFPPLSWFGHRSMGLHAFPVLYGGMRMADASYFDDFWSEPGYLGYAPPPSLVRDIVQHPCEVVELLTDLDADAIGLTIGRQAGQARGDVDTAWQGAEAPPSAPVAVRLSNTPGIEILGAELVVMSGAAAGERLLVVDLVGEIAVFGPVDANVVAQLRPGDAVELDNRGFLAAQTYHRHQVPGPDYPVWDQFRNADGSPIYPQRPLILGPLFAAGASGTVQTGRFDGKMILVESLLDREALPWQADWYRSKVHEHVGDAIDDCFRLWFTDHALHGDNEIQEDPTHTISYIGVLHQALRRPQRVGRARRRAAGEHDIRGRRRPGRGARRRRRAPRGAARGHADRRWRAARGCRGRRRGDAARDRRSASWDRADRERRVGSRWIRAVRHRRTDHAGRAGGGRATPRVQGARYPLRGGAGGRAPRRRCRHALRAAAEPRPGASRRAVGG